MAANPASPYRYGKRRSYVMAHQRRYSRGERAVENLSTADTNIGMLINRRERDSIRPRQRRERRRACRMLFSLATVVLLANSHVLFGILAEAVPSAGRQSLGYESIYFSEEDEEEKILAALEKAIDSSSYDSVGYSEDLTSQDEEVGIEKVRDGEESRLQPTRKTPSSPEQSRPTGNLNREEIVSQGNLSLARNLSYVSLPYHFFVNGTTTPEKSSAVKGRPPTETSSSFASSTTPWVRQFLASCHRDVLLPVPRDYWSDNFNLAHLPPVVEKLAALGVSAGTPVSDERRSYPVYRQALRLITQDDIDTSNTPDYIQGAARILYFLVHQRYVLSPRGLDTVRRRFLYKAEVDPIFGKCPGLGCNGMPLLPYGASNDYNPSGSQDSRAKRYCASCEQVFYHWDSKVDGCAWGNSFCHLFLMEFYDELFSSWRSAAHVPPTVKSIFGFPLHSSATVASKFQL
jgi:hypothetical protein